MIACSSLSLPRNDGTRLAAQTPTDRNKELETKQNTCYVHRAKPFEQEAEAGLVHCLLYIQTKDRMNPYVRVGIKISVNNTPVSPG